MRYSIFLTGALLALLSSATAFAQPLKNKLKPFSTDGCSNFPDGVPFFADKLWLRCCVEHDVTYWQGGTLEMRKAADEKLHACVIKNSGSKTLANLIWAGVRVGGRPELPTSTGWGKGWTIQRGYREFTEEEKEQIAALTPTLPQDISDLELEKRSTIRPRFFLTNDHCLDLAIIKMQLELRAAVEIESKEEERASTASGEVLKLTVKAKGCDEPFRFEFLLLRSTACTDEMNELAARGRIRLQKWSAPKNCGGEGYDEQ